VDLYIAHYLKNICVKCAECASTLRVAMYLAIVCSRLC